MARVRFLAYAFFVLFGLYVLIEVNHLRSESRVHRCQVSAFADSQRSMLREISSGQERLAQTLRAGAHDWRAAAACVRLEAESALARAGDLKGDLQTLVRDTVTEIVHRELAPRTKAMAEAIDRSSSYTERLAKLEPQILASCRPEADRARLREAMLYPTVQLRGKGTVGSGVIVWSGIIGRHDDRPVYGTYALTAHHVVTEVAAPDRRDVIEDVRLMGADDRLTEARREAYVVAFDRRRDLALLALAIDEPARYVAAFAAPAEVARIQIFDPAYAVGCPLGNLPLPTAGEISTKHKVVDDQVLWMLNAPTFFGNSGGGIFRAGDGKLIGIASMVYTYGRANPVVVPHLGLFVPLTTVCEWLNEEGYAFLYDARKQPPAELLARARTARRAAPREGDAALTEARPRATSGGRKE
ncbi:MAG TPA: serine protease [Planctomycetota bacterium]|jgi:S1-C subfamily serine protease|nr:trypsin-like peptidase domain-containing protein [Planctomycetota bacterium]OQC20341.1 MAG: hypothetical protein BWX69_01837 [Planctomycetes bacterium ADurb.Bin069]HNR98674.1 serine protease [Planctomycetota bacterium]HNU25054.1 serine protease [Planctomycetota bacterium]HOE28462.1 serine protease [Planctomycetota bacterium]